VKKTVLIITKVFIFSIVIGVIVGVGNYYLLDFFSEIKFLRKLTYKIGLVKKDEMTFFRGYLYTGEVKVPLQCGQELIVYPTKFRILPTRAKVACSLFAPTIEREVSTRYYLLHKGGQEIKYQSTEEIEVFLTSSKHKRWLPVVLGLVPWDIHELSFKFEDGNMYVDMLKFEVL
jgi:hypothetical protein